MTLKFTNHNVFSREQHLAVKPLFDVLPSTKDFLLLYFFYRDPRNAYGGLYRISMKFVDY